MSDATAIDGTTYVARSRETVTAELDGEAVVYHEVHGSVTLLDPSATMLWNRLDGSTHLSEVARGLASATGADPVTVERDVIAAARRMAADGLLDRWDDSGAG